MEKLIKIIFLAFIFCFSLSVSAKVKVRAYAQPSAVALNDVLTLTVEVEYSTAKEMHIPRLPKISPFELIDSHQGSNISIIGWNVIKKKQYNYGLRSRIEGDFQIGPISVVVDGKVYKTDSVSIKVSKNIAPKQPTPFGQVLPHLFRHDQDMSPLKKQQQDAKRRDIKFRLDIEKKEAYVGEMILAEWFFYFPGRDLFQVNAEVLKTAKLDGFWVESVVPLGQGGSVPPQLGKIDGKNYLKALLMASALFPLHAGTLTVGSVRVKSRFLGGFLSSILGGSSVLEKNSNQELIKVLPLPKEGRGKMFTEAVGDFTVSASVDKKVISVQEPLVYKVRFEGAGHPRLIRLPDMDFGPSFEKYAVTESQKFTVSDSFKEFEVILIPKKSGKFTLPSFELSTFDAELGILQDSYFTCFHDRGDRGESSRRQGRRQ